MLNSRSTRYLRRPLVWALLGVSLIAGCGQANSQVALNDSLTSNSQDSRCVQDSVYIERGRYVAGSDQAERDYAYRISAEALADRPEDVAELETRLRQQRWFDFEPDQSTRRMAAFCIGRNLVTNEEYQEFVLATGYHQPGITPENYQEQNMLVHSYQDLRPYFWRSFQFPPGKASYPVVLVSQKDALAYAAWKSQEDGVEYSLPTADEWEKAARGQDGRYFTWGNNWQGQATNWQKNGPTGTSRVSAYPLSQSVYGVEDMAGNVFEFTSTVYRQDGQERAIMKGCAWDDLPGFCRTAYRHGRPTTYRHILFGFRLVSDPQR
ncbi:sulfatase-modifying factor protein [Leptolyngbya sp. Heron Island J]|uniref:formylglycine-generating enzyme family protein n=1 Tax=Leptolyngbya sp. Heron Island J TaxID=1385935 RepID=UPI0003B9E055|nr:SUMF1/EgtB/PvdO family nonheme iron enzyme [Leptolyngbya sp. Heron Island J]ESA37080.1 sulfatase-modifying factor protein [Leptolyngbya sp. Heron Island J]